MRWCIVFMAAVVIQAFPANADEPDPQFDLPILPGRERTDCRPEFVTPKAARHADRIECVRFPIDLANRAQEVYERFLYEAGWEFDKAEANGFGFRDGDRYLIMMAVPFDLKDLESGVIFYFWVGPDPETLPY